MRILALDSAQLAAWRANARDSILEINDGIASAAGVAEGFAAAGATVHTLLLAGLTVIVAGSLTAAGARYSEVRTEWEMNRNLIELTLPDPRPKGVWPRTNERHIATDDIDQLGQLIQAGAAQQPSNPCYTIVGRCRLPLRKRI